MFCFNILILCSAKKSFDVTSSHHSRDKDAPPSLIEQKQDKKSKKGAESEEELQTGHQLELAQDDAIDPTPFKFKPYQLAHMLDPKNIESLISFGGTSGLLRGLGVNHTTGLVTKGAGNGASHRHDTQPPKESTDTPRITLTEPSGNVAAAPTVDEDAAFAATLDDRRRVFGENHLPTRASKTLLQLMWMALQDKVLVRLKLKVNVLCFVNKCSCRFCSQ